MADSILKIEGIHPQWDGEYTIDPSGFTNRDFHDIKRISGLRPTELGEAFQHGDTDLFVAFAAIALRHAGKPVVEDVLMDAPFGQITLTDGVQEEEQLPPASPSPSVTPSVPVGDGSTSVSTTSSGLPSSDASASPEPVPSLSGVPISDTGVTSPLEMSAS